MKSLARSAPAIATLLGLGAFVLYAQTGTFQFILLDDARYLIENPHVRTGLSSANAAWAFTALAVSNWHPLTWLSHQLDVQLFGMRAGPHHLVNAALHAANTALLFLLLVRMTGERGRSALVAALFAVHPLHVESVAWVAERKDVLSTFFGFLALLAYALYAERPGARRYALVALCFVLSLLAKPMWVTLPALLLVLDAWPLRRGWRLLEKLPLLGLSIASSIVTVIAQGGGGSINSLRATSMGERLANAAVAYAQYLGKTLWPASLSPYYPWRGAPPWWQIGSAVLLLGAISVVALAQRRQRPWIAAGWLWFLGMLVPVIGLVQVGSQSMADRYSYVSIIGLFVAVIWTVRIPQAAQAPAAAALLIALSLTTWREEAIWFDQETLFRHAIKVDPDSGFAHGALADGLRSKGRLEEARREAEEAVRLSPNSSRHWNALGIILLDQRRLLEAQDAFARSVRLDVTYVAAFLNLAEVAIQTGELQMADGALGQALRLAPEDGRAHQLLGALFERMGDLDSAVAEYAIAVRLRPDSADAWSHLAILYEHRGQHAEAGSAFEAAVRVSDSFESWRNLGLYYAKAGRPADAQRSFERALALRPADPNVLGLLRDLRAAR